MGDRLLAGAWTCAARVLPLALCGFVLSCSGSAPPSPAPSGLVGASITDWRLTGRVDSKSRCDQTEAPRAISSRQARYPEDLLRKKIEGTVALQATVAPDGIPGEFKVIRSDAAPLSDLALETFREWRYKPALCDGKPVDAYVTATFSFRIER
jgi:TonB family protein